MSGNTTESGALARRSLGEVGKATGDTKYERVFNMPEQRTSPYWNQRVGKRRLLDILEMHSARINMLDAKQAVLAKLFLSVKNYRTIAKMAGVNEATIARRLKRIANHLGTVNLPAGLCQNNPSPAETMEIINDYFINGLSVKIIAEKTGLSHYKITKTIKQMRKL